MTKVRKNTVRVAYWGFGRRRNGAKEFWLVWEDAEHSTHKRKISKGAFEVLKQVLPSEG